MQSANHPHRAVSLILTLALSVGVLAACSSTDETDNSTLKTTPATASTVPPTTTQALPPTTTQAPPVTTGPAAPPITVPPPMAAGKVVVLDPGHNGANAANTAVINQPVPDGAGGTKPCNTTGTATNAGFAEHAFTWDVTLKIKAALEAKGVKVVMTRPDDAGVGPCVDKRAAIGNGAAADAVVSIHGDGAAAGSHGFFCITSALKPAGAAMDAQSLSLAGKVRDSVAAGGTMPVANYEGSNGLDLRTDLAGLNLSTRPTTMCEMGNMRSATDAAIMTSEAGRAGLAAGISAGILGFLG